MGAPTSWALFFFATTGLCIVASERSNSNPILSLQDESDNTQIAAQPSIIAPANEVSHNGLMASEENASFHSSSEPIALVKRAPTGFMGMRGKKDDTEYEYEYEDEEEDDEEIDEELEAIRDRLIFDFLSNPTDVHNPIIYHDLWKRAPSGFLGMRGKKGNKLWDGPKSSDEWLNAIDFQDKLANERQMLYNLGSSLEARMPKRAPSGFMGMRGKKTFSDEYVNEKRAPSGFMGMRGKKLFNTPPQYLDEKRAPSGFMGMRGKRFYTDGVAASAEEKRGPSAGFVGMRGKKLLTENNFPMMDKIDSMEMKGAAVRGKKDVANVLGERPRLQSFFALRGKKQPSNGFFGMRGKKGPFSEFRGKFVGVRGKKNPSYDKIMKLAMDMEDIETGLHPATLVNSEIGANKRLPSGFLGARGKKWSDSGNTLQ